MTGVFQVLQQRTMQTCRHDALCHTCTPEETLHAPRHLVMLTGNVSDRLALCHLTESVLGRLAPRDGNSPLCVVLICLSGVTQGRFRLQKIKKDSRRIATGYHVVSIGLATAPLVRARLCCNLLAVSIPRTPSATKQHIEDNVFQQRGNLS